MHESSMREMSKFIHSLYKKHKNTKLNIMDVGSRNLQGGECYKDLIDNPNWSYVGLDTEPGDNVDIVTRKPYAWIVADKSIDVVISGQCLEHVPQPWRWMWECFRVLKAGGVVCVIAPHTFKYHTEGGDDCWRIWPAGMLALLESSCFEKIEVYKNSVDTVGIGYKL